MIDQTEPIFLELDSQATLNNLILYCGSFGQSRYWHLHYSCFFTRAILSVVMPRDIMSRWGHGFSIRHGSLVVNKPSKVGRKTLSAGKKEMKKKDPKTKTQRKPRNKHFNQLKQLIKFIFLVNNVWRKALCFPGLQNNHIELSDNILLDFSLFFNHNQITI